MSVYLKPCCKAFLLSFCLLLLIDTQAFAQFGVGVGFGTGNWGPGGWYGPYYGNRGFFGVGASFWRPYRSHAARVPQTVPDGYVVGRINACPLNGRSRVCAIPEQVLQGLVINAVPQQGSSQWMSTRPSAQGNFQLKLPPGHYQLTLSTATGTAPSHLEVTVSSGQTVYQEINLQSALE